jgi:hypothetical protein
MWVTTRNVQNATEWATLFGFQKTGRQQEFNAQQVTGYRAVLLQDLAQSNAPNLEPVKTWFS